MKKLIPFSLFLWMLVGQAWAQTCVTTYPYFENFEASNGNWTAGGTSSTWAWGTPAKPVIQGAASGTKAWVTNLTGIYNSDEVSHVTSPCFNFSTLVQPIFQAKIWWSSETSWDGAVLQSSIDNGASWQKVGAFGHPNNWYNTSSFFNSPGPGGQQEGWSGTANSSSGGYVLAKHTLTGLGGQSNVKLRIAFASDAIIEFDGFAFDDVTILETPSTDLELTAITSPTNGCALSATETVCVTITNKGIAPQSNFQVSYQIGAAAPVVETVTATIAPLGTYTYCFTTKANLSTPGAYNFTATTMLTGDGDPSNNSATRTVTSIPVISTFPYSQNFENGQGGWTSSGTNSSWAFGTPAKSIIQGAASGVNAWVTNLTGNYNDNENSQVLGPCFNFAGLPGDPDFEMKAWWDAETSYDGAVLQSSINGGTTWQNVGNLMAPNNWYNDGTINGNPGGQQVGWTGSGSGGSNGWVKVKHKLNGLGGQSAVLLRVAFGSEGFGTANGFAFDDIRIGDNTNNLAINSFTALTQVCGFGTNEQVQVEIENLGSVAVTNYNIEYRVDGATNWTPGTNKPTLLPDTPIKYTFNTGANLSTAGPHTIEVRITNLAATDPELGNNTIVYNVTNALYSSLPITLDFETPPTSVSAARTITKSKSSITELSGAGNGTGKGLIMAGVDDPKWEIPVGLTNPWTTNPENLSAVYICLGPTNIGSDLLKLTLHLRQYFKTSMYSTNFRITVNGQQVGPTYRPPFNGYPTGTTPPWDTIVVDLTPYKNKGGIQIGLESSVREDYNNANGTANVIDNVKIERLANPNVGIKDNILQSNVTVYPNPSTGMFNLNVPTSARSYEIEVTDLTGKLVKRQSVSNNSGESRLDLNGKAKGIYILKITSEGNIATRKLIVE